MANDRFMKIGSDGQASEYKTGLVAGEALAQWDVVRFSPTGALVKAKASEIAMCKNVAGIVTQAAGLGDPVFLCTNGEVTEAISALTENKVYFLSTSTPGGVQDTVAPEGNVILRIGYTDSLKKLFVKISDPIIRNGGAAPDIVLSFINTATTLSSFDLYPGQLRFGSWGTDLRNSLASAVGSDKVVKFKDQLGVEWSVEKGGAGYDSSFTNMMNRLDIGTNDLIIRKSGAVVSDWSNFSGYTTPTPDDSFRAQNPSGFYYAL